MTDRLPTPTRKTIRPAAWLRQLLLVLLTLLATVPVVSRAEAASRLAEYLPKVQPADLFPGADRFGEPAGEPPIAPVWQGETLVGYAYLNSDFTSATGYSGKPIHILAGIDPQGVLRGFKLVHHQEPIVLIGIPEEKVVAALDTLIGRVAAGAERPPQVDIVSGATVTVLVMGDSVVCSAVRLIRSGRLGGRRGGRDPHAQGGSRRGPFLGSARRRRFHPWPQPVRRRGERGFRARRRGEDRAASRDAQP